MIDLRNVEFLLLFGIETIWLLIEQKCLMLLNCESFPAFVSAVSRDLFRISGGSEQ